MLVGRQLPERVGSKLRTLLAGFFTVFRRSSPTRPNITRNSNNAWAVCRRKSRKAFVRPT